MKKVFICTCTQTPNLSFEALKGIGKISGVAFDPMMIDAHLKAKNKKKCVISQPKRTVINI